MRPIAFSLILLVSSYKYQVQKLNRHSRKLLWNLPVTLR